MIELSRGVLFYVSLCLLLTFCLLLETGLFHGLLGGMAQPQLWIVLLTLFFSQRTFKESVFLLALFSMVAKAYTVAPFGAFIISICLLFLLTLFLEKQISAPRFYKSLLLVAVNTLCFSPLYSLLLFTFFGFGSMKISVWLLSTAITLPFVPVLYFILERLTLITIGKRDSLELYV